MSTPVDSPTNPFEDPAIVADLLGPMDNSHPSTQDHSKSASAEASQPGSAGGRRKEKKRVGFTGGTNSAEMSPRGSWYDGQPTTNARALSPPTIFATPPQGSADASGASTPGHSRQNSRDIMLPPAQDDSRSHLPELSLQQTQELHKALGSTLPVPKPRPAIRRTSSDHRDSDAHILADTPEDDDVARHRHLRAVDAHERAKRLETDERIRSEPNSRFNSPERDSRRGRRKARSEDIALKDLPPMSYDGPDSDSDDGLEMPRKGRNVGSTAEAFELVRKHTMHQSSHRDVDTPPSPGLPSGAVTPIDEHGDYEFYRPRPKKYQGGILSSLMKLHAQQRGGHSRSSSANPGHQRHYSDGFSQASTPQHSPSESGASTPTAHWYARKHKNNSSPSLVHLVGSSASLSSAAASSFGDQLTAKLKEQQDLHHPGMGKRTRSGNALAALHRASRPRMDEEIRITVHIANYMIRQKYLIKLCRALMLYGAPTHRLEEYMNMSARVLEIQAQFLYIPGSMIMSFDDPETHTTEVKLVRVTQGLDLGKLRDVHEVYKEVVHDHIGAEQARSRLDEIFKKKEKHNKWFRILIYGCAAACVGPFAFGARFIDLPIAFLLGCILGFLQLVVAPRSDLYANVFEIAATVITSFLSRAFGSIPNGHGGRLFCFSALAQSSIALILPGYIVLCASLELQSRSIVAGSIRMVYAIIYSLFLGFGITIGTAIYGIFDVNAVSSTTCDGGISEPYYFPFVPAFAMTLIIINQAKWKQAPVMLIIAFVGFLVNHYSSRRFAGNTQISNTLGALAIGVLANLYSRVGAPVENKLLDLWEDKYRHYWKDFQKRVLHIRRKASITKSAKVLEEGSTPETESIYVRQTRRVGYGLAAAAMLPAIFVQVPSGLAVSGSLVSGLASANQIAGNATNGTTVVNSTTITLSSQGLNSIAFNVGYSVIQVAIGITVGLFLSAVIVYPFGKKRSGLFSF
ncbi:hypothetical protein LTS14_009315 [Recurvomyces mirabilis]|nr:hypothetical protein LTS14_009315 [Recurvomyces mirabilis]